MKTPVVQEQITFGNRQVLKIFRKVKKAKHVRIHVTSADQVLITGPYPVSFREFQKFFVKHQKWISEKLAYFEKFPNSSLKLSASQYQQKKEPARKLAHTKLAFWNQYYNFSWKRVAIRNQKTRWGSCSSAGTLSFHAAIVDLPEELQDYLVVHELCHIEALNHSQVFWKLMERVLPNARALDASLKKYKGASIL